MTRTLGNETSDWLMDLAPLLIYIGSLVGGFGVFVETYVNYAIGLKLFLTGLMFWGAFIVAVMTAAVIAMAESSRFL